MPCCDASFAGDKQALRRRMAGVRDHLSPGQREALSSLVCRNAWQWAEHRGASSILAYAAFRSELDTRPLLEAAWKANCRVYLPRALPGSRDMALHLVRSWSELIPGAFGIPEPSAGLEPLEPGGAWPEAVFVPGLAFDRRGGRLGYGRGYYDTLHAAWPAGGNKAAWIGLAYGAQLVDEVPVEAHDARMDAVITENGIIDCRKGE